MKYVIAPSYLETKNTLTHSAKGTTWKDHKYIKKINGVYYYTKEELSNAIKSGKASASELKSDLDARKELGKVNKETNSKRAVAITTADYTLDSDKDGLTQTSKYIIDLDKRSKIASQKYSKTKLSEVEADKKIVNNILNIVYGPSKANVGISERVEHYKNVHRLV
jgi:hypothetical protein